MKDKEEENLLREISDKVDSLIDKIFNKYSFDRAYYNFKLSVDVLDEDFNPYCRRIILEDNKGSVCAFCGVVTNYYDSEIDKYLCFSHFLEKRNKEKNERKTIL